MMIALACALMSAVMFYLAFGISDLWYLAWFASAPILWLAYGPERAWRVAAASFVSFAMGMVYLYQVYGWFMAAPGTVQLIGQSLLFALAVLFSGFVHRRLPSVAAMFAFPACWTTFEYGLGWISPNGAWGAMGYTQVSWPAAIQIASVTGVYGVTFLVCLFGSAVALAARKEWRSASLGAGLCAAVIAAGFLRLEAPRGETVRVAALGQISDDSRKAFGGDPVAAAAIAKVYAAGIREAAAQGAHIMVTPETDVDADALAPIEAAAKETNSIVDVGTHGRSPARNMAVVLISGRSPFVYDKRHRLLPGESVYTPGTRSGYFGNGLATAICKDLDFPRTIRSDAQAGTRLLIVGADDFGLDGWMHARQAIMRGVENGAAVVRIASRGLATISDENGRVLARAPVEKPGFVSVVADVPLGQSNTIYKQFGDLFAWLVGIGSIGLAVLSVRSARRAATPGKTA
jgi:apolipoprotein N-acyltransferase